MKAWSTIPFRTSADAAVAATGVSREWPEVAPFDVMDLFLNVSAISGSGAGLRVYLEEQDPVSLGWLPILDSYFPTVTATTSVPLKRTVGRFATRVRAAWTVIGSTPSITFTLGGVPREGGGAGRVFNKALTLLDSAVRATDQTIECRNPDCRGALFTLDVTVITGTGLIFRVRGKDPTTGKTTALNAAPTNVTSTGTYQYWVYPGANGTNGATTQALSQPLPETFEVFVDHTDSASITYSLSMQLVV